MNEFVVTRKTQNYICQFARTMKRNVVYGFVKPHDAMVFDAVCGGEDLGAPPFTPRAILIIAHFGGNQQYRTLHARIQFARTLLPQRAQNFHVARVGQSRTNRVVSLNLEIL